MIAKVSIGFEGLGIPEKITTAEKIIISIIGNVDFPDPNHQWRNGLTTLSYAWFRVTANGSARSSPVSAAVKGLVA